MALHSSCAGKKLEAVESQLSSSGRLGRFVAGAGAKKGGFTRWQGSREPRQAWLRMPSHLCSLTLAALTTPSALPACTAEDGKLEQVVRDTARVAAEQVKGLSTQV